jgi:pyruvate/2-oxoglutarate dehydrogenase complex dihydrolipoamide dehydrogenase (E3) component
LGLDTLGIQTDKLGRIQVDDHFRTAVPSIYAIGDCINGPMLAHKAEEEGIAAVEIMAGFAGHVNYDAIPGTYDCELRVPRARVPDKGFCVSSLNSTPLSSVV